MNSQYWKQRFIELEDVQNKQSGKYIDILKEEYNKSLSKIEKEITNWYIRLADNNELNYTNAKKMLDRKELQEFKWTVEEYIEKGRENGVSQKWIKELENASVRVHIDKLNAIKIQIQNELEQLYNKQNKEVTELVKQQHQNAYYKSAYEIQKGLEKYWNVQALDTNKIEKVISKPWTIDNQTFSDRIWKNKDELLNTLQKELTQATIRGDNLSKVIKKIEKDFEVSKNKASRLVMTESAFFNSVGQQECFNSLGVKQYEVIATLDTRTSEMCQELDGKIFDMKDYEIGATAPPFHCYCRTVTAPYFDDEFTEEEKRAYRDEDGKTEDVNSNMKYKEWKEKYVTNVGNYDKMKANSKKSDIYSSKITKLEKIKDLSDRSKIQTLEKYENQIVNKKVENAVIIDKEGQTYLLEGNSSNSIYIKNMENKLKGSYMTHNHPKEETQYSFSAFDVSEFMETKIQKLRGVDNKYIYEIERTKNTINVDRDTILHEFGNDIEKEALQIIFQNGYDTDEELYHLENQILAKKYKYKYRRIKK